MNITKFDEAGAVIYSCTYNTTNSTVTIFENGVTTTQPADPSVIAAMLQHDAWLARRQRLEQAAATLRSWAVDARSTNVGPMTVAQHKAVTQTVVDRLGVFFDRFADLLDERQDGGA